MGALVNGLSQELISFGKDSIDVYRNYEKSMKDAEVALSTAYGRGTRELSTVMKQLDASATEWAASTIFHTNDVADAISEAAHAGWDYEQIMAGIPAAMQLAQAGGLDLSEAVNYIVKSTNAAGIEFKDMSKFIDLWTFAANSSASTIGEFGDAMLRMGSTMRFAGNTEELMTLIAVTANAGSTGSSAGTLIRNSLMRLIAPTDKAREAMAQLGATSEESAGLLEDEALAAANAELAAHGFSAFDSEGNLKNVLDMYRELYLSLGEIAGGFDSIDRNEDALAVLSAIFPTRTITEALTLLRSAAEGYDGLYDSMRGGDAKGYGEYAAETMMNTLDGRIETFGSKVERLKQLVGEELSGQVADVLGGIGNIVDNIANLDDGAFSALVAGAEVIAGAGPGLLLAGTAFRFIGQALTPAGLIGLGLVTLTGLVAAVEKLEEADFEGGFGLAEMDHQAINSYLTDIRDNFESAYEQVDNFRQAVDESVTSYTTASETFGSELLTNMLTGAVLSDSDIAQLESLGNDMHQAVIAGITNSTAGSMSYFEMLFGGEGAAEANPEYRDIIDLTNTAYEESIAQAESIGREMRDALTSAFADGTISPEEYQNILSYMQSYNEALAQASAEAQSEQDYIDQQMLLHKAQTASLDEIESVAKEIQDERERVLSEAEDTYLRERYGLEYRYNQAVENGGTVNGEKATAEGRDAALAAVDEKYQQQILRQSENYDDIMYNLWDSQIRQSDYADAYSQLEALAARVLSGELTTDTAISSFKDEYGSNKYAGEWDFLGDNTRTRIGEMLARQIAGLGGYEELEAKISDYEARGETEHANDLRKLYTMQQINDSYARTGITENPDLIKPVLGEDSVISTGEFQMQRPAFEAMLNSTIQGYTTETAKKTVEAFKEGENSLAGYFETIGREARGQTEEREMTNAGASLSRREGNELNNIISQLGQNYDLNRVLADTAGGTPFANEENALRDAYAAYSLMFGEASANPEQYRIQVVPEVDPDASLELEPVPVPIEPHLEGEDSINSLQNQGVQVQVSGDTQQLQATIDASDGQTLLEYINGDASDLSMTITDQDGQVLVENVTGNTEELTSAISEYSGQTVTVNVTGKQMFDPVPVPITPYMQGTDSISSLKDQGVQVQVSGDTQQLQATIDASDGQTLLEYVNGDASDLSMAITAQDGRTLTEYVTGNTASLAAAINSYNGRTITVNIAGRQMFASGGRATTASVFGEAGPEWAIPEEHTDRTAELLNAARAASGFTWPDLLERFGGTGGTNTGSSGTTVIYSPVINAKDAAGVDEALREDKKRLEKWFEERRMRDAMEVYR